MTTIGKAKAKRVAKGKPAALANGVVRAKGSHTVYESLRRSIGDPI